MGKVVLPNRKVAKAVGDHGWADSPPPLAVAKAVAARKAGKVTYPYYMLVEILAKVGQKPRPTSETANWFGE